jgi:hypothetical protein
MVIACRQEPPHENAMAERSHVAPASKCAPPRLASADKAISEDSALFRDTKANFSTAYARACAKGLLKEKALIDPTGAIHDRLFLLNAPAANVASIYLPEDRASTVLEYPFLTDDGQTHVPPTDELEEAIYCTVHGATPDEEGSSGRCLVD